MTLSAGTRLGPYEVLSALGAGGMGEVYRARDTRLARDVAVKVLPEEFFADKDRKERFEREARLLAALNHPNIAAVFSFEEIFGVPPSPSHHLLVMELLDGESLRNRLAQGALPPRKTLELAVQIANGLSAAHEKGIVHRDLKPENVFVTKEGRVKILDFGLAKLTQREPSADLTSAPTSAPATEAGVVMGTAGYMSPEQVRGESVDAQSDIFAFGALLYEMLSGKQAFHGDTAVETLHAILKEDPPDLAGQRSKVPVALERVVRRCLEKQPGERFQSARDVAFSLEALTNISEQSAGLATLPRERRGGRLRQSLAAALIISTIALAFLVGRRSVRPEPPLFHQLTWRHGNVQSARFAPDGQTVLYSASWEGKPPAIYIKRPESPDAVPLDLPSANLLAVSPKGEMAIRQAGTLARVALTGGTPREIVENVSDADWGTDGKLVVARYVDGKSRLEYPLGKVLYEATGHVSSPRLSPRGDLIAFVDHPLPAGEDRGSIAVVDLLGEKRNLSKEFGSVRGLAWSPSGREVWFAASVAGTSRSLWGVTLSGSQRPIAHVPGDVRLDDVTRSGRVLLRRVDRRMAIRWLPPGETLERDLSWFGNSLLADLSLDGRSIVFQEQGEPAGPNYAVCLWKMDGPPVKLGEGMAGNLTPDGKWVISGLPEPRAPLVLLPTGPGEPKEIDTRGIARDCFALFPDGKNLLIGGREAGRGPSRFFVLGLDGGEPRPILPEGVGCDLAISRDGKLVAAQGPDRKIALYPVYGGDSRPVMGAAVGDHPLKWSADGRSLYVQQDFRPSSPARIFRVDLKTSQRVLFKELLPEDPAGVVAIFNVLPSPDGGSYAYNYARLLSDLYLVEGLK